MRCAGRRRAAAAGRGAGRGGATRAGQRALRRQGGATPEAGQPAATRDGEEGKGERVKEKGDCGSWIVDGGGVVYCFAQRLGFHNWVWPSCQGMCDYMDQANFYCKLEI